MIAERRRIVMVGAATGNAKGAVSSLLESGYEVAVTTDAHSVPPGPAPWMILGDFGGTPPADLSAEGGIHDIGGTDAAGVQALVAQQGSASAPEPSKPWKPWFPVIDYNRCTDCMQCLSFCLFDVYGVRPGGGIKVQNESNCKTDCPACSRVCPEVAILFPKYAQGPINGAEVQAQDLQREAMKVDISALLGGDVYSMIRQRSENAKQRFSKERDDKRALQERRKCLVDLKGRMDIPDEVFSSLPSFDEIQTKAEEARARADAALAEQSQVEEGGEAGS